jgi:Flp pilus assembly pilin Flp
MLQLVLVQFAALFHLPAFKLPTFREFLAEQSAQDAFEYLLVIGVVVVAIVAAAALLPVGTVVTAVSDKITATVGA